MVADALSWKTKVALFENNLRVAAFPLAFFLIDGNYFPSEYGFDMRFAVVSQFFKAAFQDIVKYLPAVS